MENEFERDLLIEIFYINISNSWYERGYSSSNNYFIIKINSMEFLVNGVWGNWLLICKKIVRVLFYGMYRNLGSLEIKM